MMQTNRRLSMRQRLAIRIPWPSFLWMWQAEMIPESGVRIEGTSRYYEILSGNENIETYPYKTEQSQDQHSRTKEVHEISVSDFAWYLR